MKKTKAVSLLLSLSLLATLAIPGTLAQSVQADTAQENKGMVINKTAEANDDGTYTITLEAYATGSKIISETKQDIPTDIVLVLDQSGSMDSAMSSEEAYSAYEDRSNSYLFDKRFNNTEDRRPDKNLYYPLDGGYVEVQVDQNTSDGYEAFSSQTTNSNYYSYYSYPDYYYGKLYIKDANEQYQEVTVNRTGNSNNRTYTYTITVNGQERTIGSSTGRNAIPDFGDYGPIYYAGQVYEYTYYYQLSGQDRVVIETSVGANAVPNETYYQYGTVNISRLDALKTAVTTFTNSVAEKAAGSNGILGDEDDVKHRVAVVGFASESGYGNNTELLSIAGSNSGSVGVRYSNITNQNLVDVLQDMDTQAGQTMVTNAINALTAEGATQADLGMDMANRILNANPVPQGEKRTRVVVFFTDGSPTSFDGFEQDVADAAISNASQIKSGGAYVYSVGVFPGADATANGIATNNDNRRENQFMQSVSSNNGTPQNPSYYLSASDADTLNNIFQQISDQIESGGSSTSLSSETVIRDIIAPAFTLPAGASASDIVLETWHCTGKDGDDYTWSQNSDAMGARVTIGSTESTEEITTNNQVNVTGFDFAGNYVGTVTENGNTTYRGDKLVIKITVEPREGFFGGNGVDTNTSAGVYENEDAADPVLTFPKPDVNVPLAEPTVDVPDANVYLGAYYSQTIPEDAVKMGATVTIAGYDIDFSKADDPDHPYGLEPWQVEYVNISIAATTEGNGGSFENIQEDITYTVTVTVSPKTPGPSGDETATDTGEGTIHVFKPCLTYQDSQVWYGGDVPTDFTGNLTEETWINSDGTKKHDDEGVQMLNEKPTLTLSYTPEAGKITTDGKVNTKQDIGVNATVKIGENDVLAHTTFKHTSCGENCSWNIENPNGSPAFLLHVNTCQLTISKSGGASDEPYVFTVYKDGKEYSEVTIVGNTSETIYELPVGTYTIKEDTNWSWRYNASDKGSAELTASAPSGSIACSNSKTENYWLNGFSDVVKNIFGIKH